MNFEDQIPDYGAPKEQEESLSTGITIDTSSQSDLQNNGEGL